MEKLRKYTNRRKDKRIKQIHYRLIKDQSSYFEEYDSEQENEKKVTFSYNYANKSVKPSNRKSSKFEKAKTISIKSSQQHQKLGLAGGGAGAGAEGRQLQ